MYSRVDRYNSYVRAAIYYEHGGICFHDKEPLKYREMELDHIIPQDLFKKENEEELRYIFEKFNLPNNFHKDCLRNLVPSRGTNNRDKGTLMYTDSITSNMLDATMKMAPKIIERISSLRNQFKGDVDITKIAMQLENLNNHIDIADIYDTLTGETTFEKENEIWDFGKQYGYKKTLPNVSLSGFIPKYPNKTGSCQILFKSLRIRDCMISLNHDQILSILFSGINTDKKYGLRNFLESYNDNYFVQLGNVRLPLKSIEVEQLCEIIDDFAKNYLKQLMIIQEKLKPEIFRPSEAVNNGQRLLGVSVELWEEMMAFCSEFDYESGNSEWNIFDSNGNQIKVFSKTNHSFYEPGYHAFLIPEQEGSAFQVRKGYGMVWIVWTDIFFSNTEKNLEEYSPKKKWGPEEAYNWLTKEFIPYLIYYKSHIKSSQKSFLIRRINPSFDNFKASFDLNTVIYNFNNVSEKKDNYQKLKERISELQSYYACLLNEDLYSKDELVGLYEALHLLIGLSQMGSNQYQYIAGNLRSIVNGNSKTQILTSITEYITTIEESVIYAARLDYTLRGMLETLENGIITLSDHQIGYLFKRINPFLERKKISEVLRLARH
ncbi:hypothetical protein [Brevibacillus sp. NRS-1366]|uniref:hypothetical protein n=1 Tax=Brevibacillus sp. NRS-1366 TaxID=3233899 RepID=UPI003D21323A